MEVRGIAKRSVRTVTALVVSRLAPKLRLDASIQAVCAQKPVQVQATSSHAPTCVYESHQAATVSETVESAEQTV